MRLNYKRLKAYYQDGIAAGFEGLKEVENPHPLMSQEAAVWFLGLKEGKKHKTYAKSIDNWKKT